MPGPNARIASGTRDVLPEERAELRRVETALLASFLDGGYGEISTPAVEYAETFRRAAKGGADAAYRVLGERGEELALRSDMTVPIARVAGTRYAEADLPLRFCYIASAYRAVTPHRGQAREFLQAGVELIGADAVSGCAESLTLLCRALESAGLKHFKIGVGDAALYPALLDAAGISGEAREAILVELDGRDFVGIDTIVRSLGLPDRQAALLSEVPRMRGAGLLEGAFEPPLDVAVNSLRALLSELDSDIAARVIPDLGRFPRMSYYSGLVFEAYDPELGEPIASGGFYSDLLGKFGRPAGGVGFAIVVDLLHAALAGEERGETGR